MTVPWQDLYSKKLVSAEQALSSIKNGHTVYLASGVGEPQLLKRTLASLGGRLLKVGLIQLISVDSESRLASPELAGNFRYNTFYTGGGVSEAVSRGLADYTPLDISELPEALRSGWVLIDVALILVSPPDSSFVEASSCVPLNCGTHS